MAHCGSCHNAVFSTVANFDKHRSRGKCIDPASVGLELRTSGKSPTWAMPSDPEWAERFSKPEE